MIRTDFHFGLFYNALIGLIGREPDRKVCRGLDGFYEFIYKPRDATEDKVFSEHSYTIAQWLDTFNILFSGSRCEYGRPIPTELGNKKVLQIRISLPK